MAETKTKPTVVKVKDFIAAIEDDIKRNDALTLVKLMQDATGEKPACVPHGILSAQGGDLSVHHM